MNTNKKYAIRKLAVGIASVSIGMFISNTPEVAQTLGSVGGGVIQAFDNGNEITSNKTIKDWKPEGKVVATGEDGVPWELYENGYLLFKPVPGKDTIKSYLEQLTLYKDRITSIHFDSKTYAPENSHSLFADWKTLTYFDSKNFDTSKAKTMTRMFENSDKISNLSEVVRNLRFDSAEYIDMMLRYTELKYLDISKWNLDFQKIKAFYEPYESIKINRINFPINFKNRANVDFSWFDSSGDDEIKELNKMGYTNKWIREDGKFKAYTISELSENWRPEMAGVWIREPLSTKYTLNFNSGTTEQITPVDVEKDIQTILPTPTVDNPGYKFLGWSKTQDGEVITDTTNIGDPGETITLYAKWKKVNNVTKQRTPIEPTTVYQGDNTLDKGQRNEKVGQVGEKEVITTYKVTPITGELTEPTTTENIITPMSPKVVKVGTKPTSVEKQIDLPIVEKQTDKLVKGKERITQGRSRIEREITEYTVNETTGEITGTKRVEVVDEGTPTVKEIGTREPVNKIVNEQGKELTPEDLINYTEPNYDIPDSSTAEGNPIYKVQKITTTYKGDESLDKGQQVVEKDGKIDGNKVVRVGTKPTVEVEKLPSPVRYEKDNSREKGQENITVKGKDGSKTTTTTYTVNAKTGEVVPNVGKPVVVEPTETVVKVAAKDKVSVEKLPSPVRYEKDNSREKGQENITVKGKDGSKTTTTTYTVNAKTGEVVPNVGKPVVVEPTETVVKVAAKDKVEVVNKKDGETVKIITSYEVNPKTGELKEVKKEELLSKKGIPEVLEELTDFKGGVNPAESIVREDLPELKVALIKDVDGNILDVIKEAEEPKDIQGYKNTGKTEVDKDGYKVYIYEKLKENKQESPVDKKEETDKPKTEEKVISKDKEVYKDNNKEVISKKEELPKTSSSMLATVGLFSIFGLRKNRKKDK